MKNVSLSIPAMQSAHCQMRVRNAINTVTGVSINSIVSGSATVSLENDAQYQEVVTAIENAGYQVDPAESTANPEADDATFRFKTNINCGGCVAVVRPFLDRANGICHWDVDVINNDKILSVHSDGITRQEVIDTVKRAGFNIESVNN